MSGNEKNENGMTQDEINSLLGEIDDNNEISETDDNEDVLSQDEVNDLLSAVSGEDMDLDESASSGPMIKLYDMARPDFLDNESMAIIQSVIENRAEELIAKVVPHSALSMKLTSIDQLTYEEFTRGLPNPCCAASIKWNKSMGGEIVLEADLSAAKTLAFIELGQSAPDLIKTNLTPLEGDLFYTLVKFQAEALFTFKTSVKKVDNPQSLDTQSYEPVLVSVLELNEEQTVRGRINVMLTRSALHTLFPGIFEEYATPITRAWEAESRNFPETDLKFKRKIVFPLMGTDLKTIEKSLNDGKISAEAESVGSTEYHPQEAPHA